MQLLRLFFTVRDAIARVLPLMRNPRVPLWLKAGTIGLGLLIVSPLDPLSDIPILGLVDDAVLLLVLSKAFVSLAQRWAREAAPLAEAQVVTPRAEAPVATPLHLPGE